MAELKLTAARVKLLQAIFDGAVRERHGGTIYVDCIGAGWPLGGSRHLKVTARVEELARVGWAKRGVDGRGFQAFAAVDWELTDAGRAALESVP